MSCRILIVEEHDECRELFAEYLRRCGYDVLTACDQRTCISLLAAQTSLDVLIVSGELSIDPDEVFSGDWLHRLRMMPAIIVLTADMEPNCPWKSGHGHRIDWIRRPFRLTDLLALIQSMERVPRNRWRCSRTVRGSTFYVPPVANTNACDCPSPDACFHPVN